MKIASFNINSVRLRLDLVIKVLRELDLDILCLQETKCPDEHFPNFELEALGYKHNIFSGEKSYNGVTIISRVKLLEPFSLSLINENKRHIAAKIADNGVELHNIYIPAGGDEPDIKTNPKFAHKLDYVDAIGNWFLENRSINDKIIAVGDFNIAPFEHDVWSHKQLLDVVSHTPIEVEKLEKMRLSLNFIDIAREFIDKNEKLYSWWSYRNQDWQKSNRGRRLDHIWATKAVGKIKDFRIHKSYRDEAKPSDHVPVMIEI